MPGRHHMSGMTQQASGWALLTRLFFAWSLVAGTLPTGLAQSPRSTISSCRDARRLPTLPSGRSTDFDARLEQCQKKEFVTEAIDCYRQLSTDLSAWQTSLSNVQANQKACLSALRQSILEKAKTQANALQISEKIQIRNRNFVLSQVRDAVTRADKQAIPVLADYDKLMAALAPRATDGQALDRLLEQTHDWSENLPDQRESLQPALEESAGLYHFWSSSARSAESLFARFVVVQNGLEAALRGTKSLRDELGITVPMSFRRFDNQLQKIAADANQLRDAAQAIYSRLSEMDARLLDAARRKRKAELSGEALSSAAYLRLASQFYRRALEARDALVFKTHVGASGLQRFLPELDELARVEVLEQECTAPEEHEESGCLLLSEARSRHKRSYEIGQQISVLLPVLKARFPDSEKSLRAIEDALAKQSTARAALIFDAFAQRAPAGRQP